MNDRPSAIQSKAGRRQRLGNRRSFREEVVLGEPMRNPMRHSTAFKPFGKWEIRTIRWLAETDRDFETGFKSLIRIQYLRAIMGDVLGFRATKGLATAERALMLSIAARHATSRDQIHNKALLMRSFADAEIDQHSNTIAMMNAALEADCERLGILFHDNNCATQ